MQREKGGNLASISFVALWLVPPFGFLISSSRPGRIQGSEGIEREKYPLESDDIANFFCRDGLVWFLVFREILRRIVLVRSDFPIGRFSSEQD